MTEVNFSKELIAFFIQDLPESIIVVLVVFSLLRLRFEWKKVLAVGFLQAIVNFVRLLPIAAGMHTIIMVVSLAVLVSLFTNTRLSRVFMAVLGCLVILLSLELAYSKPLIHLTGLSYEVVFADPFLRALFSLPYEIILLVIALGKNYYNHRSGKLIA